MSYYESLDLSLLDEFVLEKNGNNGSVNNVVFKFGSDVNNGLTAISEIKTFIKINGMNFLNGKLLSKINIDSLMAYVKQRNYLDRDGANLDLYQIKSNDSESVSLIWVLYNGTNDKLEINTVPLKLENRDGEKIIDGLFDLNLIAEPKGISINELVLKEMKLKEYINKMGELKVVLGV